MELNTVLIHPFHSPNTRAYSCPNSVVLPHGQAFSIFARVVHFREEGEHIADAQGRQLRFCYGRKQQFHARNIGLSSYVMVIQVMRVMEAAFL